jgi:hypothetical protein
MKLLVLLVMAFVGTIFSGCASVARIDMRAIPEKSALPSVADFKSNLDPFLRNRGFSLESESKDEAVRQHAIYRKGLPTSAADEACLEIWSRGITGGFWKGNGNIEVYLWSNRTGMALSVFSEHPGWQTEVDSDARAIEAFLKKNYPAINVTAEAWSALDM